MPLLDLNTDIKPWLGIDVSNTTYDTTLNIINESVEQSVLNYTEASFSLVAKSEVMDSGRTDQIVPSEYPIVSVSELRFHVEPDGSGGEIIAATEYQVKEDAILLQHLYGPKGRSLIKVDYTYGYDGLPPDVKEAMLMAIDAKFRRKGDKSIGRSSRSKKDESESFSGPSVSWDQKSGLPKEVVWMLNNYKKYEFPTQPFAQRNL